MKLLTNNYETAWPMAVKILARMAHSEQELRLKLASKGFARGIIDQVVVASYARGYLNDSILCRMLFEKHSAGGRYGIRNFINKMKQRGISDEVISEVVNRYDDVVEYQRALQLVKKRFGITTVADKIKIGRFLVNRGFTSGVISKVFEEMFLVDI